MSWATALVQVLESLKVKDKTRSFQIKSSTKGEEECRGKRTVLGYVEGWDLFRTWADIKHSSSSRKELK